MSRSGGRKSCFSILLVEDNDADARLTRRTIENGRFSVQLYVVETGEEALAFLRRQGKYSSAVKPDLVLLDLNLPGKSGQEVLSELRADGRLCALPVIVLTSSTAKQDIRRSYELQANCHVAKPISLMDYERVLRSIEEFWLQTVELPNE